MLEAKIQVEICRYLQKEGFFFHSVPNEQSHGNPVRTGQLISMGLRPGCADLIVWLGDGRIAYLEVKNEKGVQSDNQRRFQERCIAFGYPYCVVRSVEDVKSFLSGQSDIFVV